MKVHFREKYTSPPTHTLLLRQTLVCIRLSKHDNVLKTACSLTQNQITQCVKQNLRSG